MELIGGISKWIKILKKLFSKIGQYFRGTRDVYFISGMCYNCSVFDGLVLPKKYNKIYIEWEVPSLDESLATYTHRMARAINPKRKFILVGYSFGGILVQEIAKFMNPEKVILISSMKDEKEIPSLFQIAKRVNFADNIPMRLYSTSNFMINLFNRYVYNIATKALGDYMTMISPVYIRWSLRQITHWLPTRKLDNIYHIHGTRDQVFPFEQIINARAIKGGDHLMVIKRTKEVNEILNAVLEEKLADN